jgi:glutamate 5-kinase
LPVGVVGVDGDFTDGDAVMVVDQNGTELAKGVVNYSRDDLEKVKGLQSARVAELMPQASAEAIHRDYLVLV